MEITYSSKKVFKNSALSVLYKGIGMVLSLISAPLILNCLGEEKYGVWVSLLSIVSWIYYLDLGIGNGLRIRLSESLAEKKKEKAQKYISVSYAILSTISFVAFIVVAFFLKIIDLKSVLNIHGDINENINLIFAIAILFVCINFVFSLVNNIFYAVQNASAVSALTIIGQAIYILGLLLYSKTGSGTILVIATIEGISQFLKNIIGSIWAYVKYPECRIKIEKPDMKYSQGILSIGLQTFISNIAALILNSTDNIIILRYLGADVVTPYSFCYKYFAMISTVFAVIVVPLQSAYTMAYTNNNVKWIIKNLKRAMMILTVFSVGTVMAGIIFRPFTVIWLQKKLYFSNKLIVYTALYCILLMISHTFSTLTSGIGRIKETTIASVVQAFINIPVSVFFAVNLGMGVEGVILGSVIAIAISAIVGPIVSYDELRKIKEKQCDKDRK